MKTFTFRFEYTVEAENMEAAMKAIVLDLEDGYSFRNSVADVLDENNKIIATVDLEDVVTHL
jgi:hypothetical protein